MERVADGVYQVKKGFRAFVVDGDAGVTLIDTGLPKRGGVLIDGLETIGRSIEDVVSIVLTHSHADHAGNAAYLKQKSGGALYCGSADVPACSLYMMRSVSPSIPPYTSSSAVLSSSPAPIVALSYSSGSSI